MLMRMLCHHAIKLPNPLIQCVCEKTGVQTVTEYPDTDDVLPPRITQTDGELALPFEELVETLVEYWVAGGNHVLMESRD